MKVTRSSRSNTQELKGFREGYALLAHISGTRLSKIASVTPSNSGLITTKPFSAFKPSCNVLLMTVNNALYLMHSCVNTVFMDWLYCVGYL